MAKKEMTWMDVIREQLAKLRKEGKKPSIGDVTPYAKKEWAEIKAGKHPLYIQGSSKGKKRGNNKTQKMGKGKKGKGSFDKTQKNMPSSSSSSGAPSNNAAIQQMLTKMHLCKKCTTKIQKYLKTQKGGDCGCSKQGGGKKSKRKTKKMKGGERGDGDDEAEQKEEDVNTEAFVDTVGKESGEYVSDESTEDIKDEAVESV